MKKIEFFNLPKKFSIAPLSIQLPFLDILWIMLCSCKYLWYSECWYCQPWSEWKIGVASFGNFSVKPCSISRICSRLGLKDIEYDIISLLYKSITGERYTLSSQTLNCVTSVVSFSNGLLASKSLFNRFSATLPTSPLYE